MADSRGGGGVPEDTKLRLQSLCNQAKHGPSSYGTEVESDKIDSSRDEFPSSSSTLSDGSAFAGNGSIEEDTSASHISPTLINERILNSSYNALPRSTGQDKEGSNEHTDGHVDGGVSGSMSLSQEEAMRSFLCLLFPLAPYWKYEQFL